ncbi:MAG: hypothetical protein JWM16_5653 [Verrucomicrobiales bacterium]|nr:hypothetical protein [Verrucomicrobiales bacterium]
MSFDPEESYTPKQLIATDYAVERVIKTLPGTVCVPLDKVTLNPIGLDWESADLKRSMSTKNISQLISSSIGVVCGQNSGNLAALRFHSRYGFNKFIAVNPILTDTATVSERDSVTILFKCAGFYPQSRPLEGLDLLTDGRIVPVYDRTEHAADIHFENANPVKEVDFLGLNFSAEHKEDFYIEWLITKHHSQYTPSKGRLLPNDAFFAELLTYKTRIKYEPRIRSFFEFDITKSKWQKVNEDVVLSKVFQALFQIVQERASKLLPFCTDDYVRRLVKTMRLSGVVDLPDYQAGLQQFVDTALESRKGSNITTLELFAAYRVFCQNQQLPVLGDTAFQRIVPALIEGTFSGKNRSHSLRRESEDRPGDHTNRRGYRDLGLKITVLPPTGTAGTPGTPGTGGMQNIS